MDRLGATHELNVGSRSNKRIYFITQIKALLIKIASWLRLVGVSL
jgi:hypothetical protein